MSEVKQLSPVAAKRFIEIMDDPVKWAQVFVNTFDNIKKTYGPWVARWYQVEMLRDKSIKKVARCGRRTGKCLPGWVKIFDPTTGELIPIEELYKRQYANVLTMEDNYKLNKTSTTIVLDNGVKEVFKVRLKSGKEIDATGNHPLYTINGWKEIDDLKPGDYVATPRIMSHFGNKEIDIDIVKLLAYMIGDGNHIGKNLRFTTADENVLNEIKNIVTQYNCQLKQYESSRQHDYNITKIDEINNKTVPNQIREVLINYGVHNKNAHEKEIPKEIFELTKEQISIFLSRLYATDGWASSRLSSKPMSEIGYCSVSKQMIFNIQHLLLRFGIHSTIQEKKVKYKDGINIAYQLLIYAKEDIIKFQKEIGIFSKESAVQLAVDTANLKTAREDSIPIEIMEEVELERSKLGILKKDLALSKHDRLRMNYSPQRSTLGHYGKVMNNKRFVDLSESDIYWEEIISIESIGYHQTYDFTIPKTHNFVANDIIVHNTETMCIDMLWRISTNKNYRCLVITPYENQVRLIFMRLKELVDSSPLLKKEVTKSTSNPYQLIFKNDSGIFGFTTGASSGSGGASIRGQRADYIYMDEVDYMSNADFDTVTTIAAERNDIGIFMSSTPTGRRSKFYEACTNKKMGYTEHYHPSLHNPNWGPEMEAEFRAQLSEQGYVHEILAEFGTQDTGVFNKDKVDMATLHECYAYNELDFYQRERCERLQITPNMYIYEKGKKPPYNAFRTMGIDWDKYNASSSIIILDYDVNRQKFKVIKRIEVPRGEYSYDNAVNMIVDLNEQYNPSWIYCDRGSGEYQIERLHIIGDEKPYTGLKLKVKGFQFKNTLEIIDPVTRVITKEPLKPFMVTQLQIAFERENIILSQFDEVLHKQLIDYEVEKVGAYGPVFSKKNEHFVDALGLAYLAFALEFPELTKTIKQPETSNKIEFVGKQIGGNRLNNLFNSIQSYQSSDFKKVLDYDPTELPGDRPTMVKIPLGYRSSASGGIWGSRSAGTKRSNSTGRKMW